MKVGASFLIFLAISLAAIVGLVFLAFRIRRRQKRPKHVPQVIITVDVD